MTIGLSHRWFNGALVAAAAIAISYWYTWRTDRNLSVGKLLIMGLITFVAAFLADLLGDVVIDWWQR